MSVFTKELQFLQKRKLLHGNLSQQDYCGSLSRHPCRTIKKVYCFFLHVCKGKFAVFWVLCCGITCNWVLFSSLDVYFYWLAYIISKYNRLVIACIVKTATRVQRLCFTSEKGSLSSGFFFSHHLLCLRAPQLIRQSRDQSDWLRRHTSNTNGCSTSTSSKQFFKFFYITIIREKIC